MFFFQFNLLTIQSFFLRFFLFLLINIELFRELCFVIFFFVRLYTGLMGVVFFFSLDFNLQY